jgi:hypothetical protein
MNLRWGLCLAILVAPKVGAATFDVSSDTRAVVRTGDTLVYQLLTWTFGVNAATYVGALPASVGRESPVNPAGLTDFGGAVTIAADAAVPEPQPGGLLLGGGVLLCGLSVVMGRVARRRK